MFNLITNQTTKKELNDVYKTYPNTAPEGFKPFHSARIDPIYWDIPDNVSVLDVGANSGEFIKRLKAGRKGIKVKGIDLSETAVKEAQAKGLDVFLGDGESLPYPNSTFDYVLLMEVLSHTFDPKKMLSEIRRVLKKDGVLLGSCPHKNLEMHIWDDQRLHRAYYTSEELYGLLRDYFDQVFIKSLTGGQFSMGFAGTTIGNLEAEILFKCGGPDTKPWDYQLQDKDTLRVWFGPTQTPGDVYYRMAGFADKMNKLERCDALYSAFSYLENGSPGEWQQAIKRNQIGEPRNKVLLDQLDNMLRIADMSVWQITGSWDVLAFFYAYKDMRKKPFVTEIDDWLFDVPSYNLASNPYHPNSEMEKVAYKQIELSDTLIVSTHFIKDGLEEIFPGKPCYVIPNSIDFDVWDNLKRNERDSRKIRIGFTGCGNHSGDLEIVKAPILALLDEFPNVDFLLSLPFESWDKVDHERVLRSRKWVTVTAFPQFIADWNMDIGIAPLRDSNFNRAKSNLRWLEYSALKIPTVMSRVYPFQKSIKHGVDGFICNTQTQWYDALKELIVSESKRKQMGLTAYARVKSDFNMDKVAKQYKSVLEGIRNGSR